MTPRVAENLITVLLSASFVAVGCCIIRRRPFSVREINECFLAGLSICAIILFPLTFLAPHHALLGCTLFLAAAAFVALRKYIHAPAEIQPGHAPADHVRVPGGVRLIGYLGITVIVLAVGQFFIHNLRLSYLWDGYQIWGSKALLLFYKGGLSKDWFMPGEYERVLEYPPLVSLWESLIAFIRGEFEWNSIKVIFPYFFLSTIISVYYLTRAFAHKTIAIWTAACVAIVPCFATRFSIGGYADMPQACMLIGAISAFVYSNPMAARFRRLAPWILCGVCMTKSEGSILLLIFSVIAGLFYGFRRTVIKRYWDCAMIVFSAFILRNLYIRWLGALDPTYGPMDQSHLVRAWRFGFQIPVVCAKYLLDRAEWGLLWPAFILSAGFLLIFGPRLQRALALGGVSAVSAYTLIFYFTNWEYKWHIELAYNRLLTQITPVAVVVCAAALMEFYARLTRVVVLPVKRRQEPEVLESRKRPHQ